MAHNVHSARFLAVIMSLPLVSTGAAVNSQTVDNTDSTALEKDFLEFLADWETASGDWIDPEELSALLPAKTEASGDLQQENSDAKRAEKSD